MWDKIISCVRCAPILLSLLTYHGTRKQNGVSLPVVFRGKVSLSEAMIGYSFHLDPLYIKLYGGAHQQIRETASKVTISMLRDRQSYGSI